MFDSDVFDFRFDIGVSQPASSIRLVDLPRIIDLFVSHSTIVCIKAQLDQMVDGLKAAHILELFQRNPRRMGELDKKSYYMKRSRLRLQSYQPCLSPHGHNQREAEETVIVYFSEFVQHIEGNMTVRKMVLNHALICVCGRLGHFTCYRSL